MKNPPKSSVIQKFSQIAPESTQWLWNNRIPQGEITLLDGYPDVNKTAVTIDVAARLSRGDSMPCEESRTDPAGTLFLIGEDSVRKTIWHRLEAAGANMDLVAVPKKYPTIPNDLPTLERGIREVNAKLLVLDTFSCFLEGNTLSETIRQKVLIPLKASCERFGYAVVGIRHFVKGSATSSLYRGGGSVAIIGAARSGLQCWSHPEDDGVRLLVHFKGNLSKVSHPRWLSSAWKAVRRSSWTGSGLLR